MSRIRFVDEMNTSGELDLGKLKRGDLVKFKSDFTKRGDDDDDDTEKKVLEGEIGEVIEVNAMAPSLLVDAPCEMNALGNKLIGSAELLVGPDDVLLMVDARDPRISHNRIHEGSLSPTELEYCVRGLHLRPEFLCARRIVVSELIACGLRRAARTVARTARSTWTDYALSTGLGRTAARGWGSLQDWPEVLVWAMDSAQNDYPGTQQFTIHSRRHVLWALEKMIDRLNDGLPEHEIDYGDEDEDLAEIVEISENLAKSVRQSTDEGWAEAVTGLGEAAGEISDVATADQLMRWIDPATWAPTTEVDDVDVLEAPGFGTAEDPESVAEQEMMDMPEWQVDPQLPAYDAPELPAPTEFEPGALDAPDEVESPELPAGLPSTPTKYDVPAVSSDESTPHGWGETEMPAASDIRAPIRVHRGYGGSGSDTSRGTLVWAEPEMKVFNAKTQARGAVVGAGPDDTLLIDVAGPEGLPASDTPEAWSIVDTRLSPDWEFPAKELSPAEKKRWRADRQEQRRQMRMLQQPEMDMTGGTDIAAAVIGIADLCATVGVESLGTFLVDRRITSV